MEDEDLLDDIESLAQEEEIDEKSLALEEDEIEEALAEDATEDKQDQAAQAQAEQARKAQELADETARLAEARRAAYAEMQRVEVEKAKLELQEAERDWKEARKAYDAGEADHEREGTAQSKLIDARVKLKLAEMQAPVEQAKPQQAPILPTAQAWVDANPRFSTDPVFRARAIQLEAELDAEGYDKSKPKFYQLLDRRIKETPRMAGNIKNGAPVSRGATRDSQSNKPSPAHEKLISSFGLNPKDKRVTEAWMNNVRALNNLQRGR